MLTIAIAPSSETGKLNVMHLKRYWIKSVLKRTGELKSGDFIEEWHNDITLLNALGLGLEETVRYLYLNTPTFEQFEDWILETKGGQLNQEKIDQFNGLISGETAAVADEPNEENVLTEEDHRFWDENGYIIVRNAVEKEDCEKAIEALCSFIGIDRYDASTWYEDHSAKQGIMIQLFQHPAIDHNRKTFRVRRAFEEIWNRKDIWVNTDRVGFNPPETASYKFQGPRLHWDASIKQPIPFGTQGILYLADTAENQGAFTLVPGFHNKIESWMAGLPEGEHPRRQDMYALGPIPIAANAGDLIIWHKALPHGSSPNTSTLPRFVQYLNYEPADYKDSDEWI